MLKLKNVYLGICISVAVLFMTSKVCYAGTIAFGVSIAAIFGVFFGVFELCKMPWTGFSGAGGHGGSGMAYLDGP